MSSVVQVMALILGLTLPAVAARPWVDVIGGERRTGAMAWMSAFPLGYGALTLWLFFGNIGLGVPVGLFSGLAGLALLGCAGWWMAGRGPGSRCGVQACPVSSNRDRSLAAGMMWWLLLAMGVVWVGMFAASLLLRAADSIPAHGAWGYKAMVLQQEGGLPVELLTDAGRPYLHQDYPLAFPLLLAWGYGWIGGFDDYLIQVVQLALVMLTMVGFYRGLREEGASPSRSLLVGLGLGVGAFSSYAAALYVEPLLLLCIISGAWHWRRHLCTGAMGDLRMGAWLLAIGAWVKNEGLLIYVLAGVLLAALMWREWCKGGRRWEAIAAMSLPVAIFVLPWRMLCWHLGLGSYDFAFSWAASEGLWLHLREVVAEVLRTMFLQPAWHGGVWWLLPVAFALWGRELWQDRAARWTFLLCLAIIVAYAGGFLFSTRRLDWHLRVLPRILLVPATLAWWMGSGSRATLGKQDAAGSSGPDMVDPSLATRVARPLLIVSK